MLDRDQSASLFSRIRRYSSADDVEVLISSGRSELTRFANNTIHQHVAEEQSVIAVRAVIGQRTARATTNKLDDDSLRRVVASAEALARVQHPVLDLLPMAEKSVSEGGPQAPSRSFAASAALTPEDRAAGVEKIVEVAKKSGLTTAGIFSSGQSVEAILNSRGLFAWHEQTSAEVSVTMLGGDSSGWQKANSPNVASLDPVALAETAARKARESAAPREVPAGKNTVVLEPAAVLDLVGFMFYDFGGMALLEQRSFLNNRLGKPIFGENVTIYDDVYHPQQSGAPFDGEGVRRKRVQLVVKGAVKNLVYARATAEKMKQSELATQAGRIEPTGHGFPLPNEMGEAPMNIVFDSGPAASTQTVEQMVASTERGILVTRLWYIREVDP
ncbi:MAG: TldD/PmbA family protein, partial [Terriglobales bacterium]